MIFVTVGTHEQQFNRLIKEVDRLVEEGIIKEEVFIQIGYSDYEPKYCKWKKLLDYDEMEKYLEEANIVITHGGPASFMGVINKNKIPIVVPRKVEFREHVNNHQLEFCNKVVNKGYKLEVLDEISELSNIISKDEQLKSITNISNTQNFNLKIKKIVEEMI
ncbi:glycosyltransferase [Enterococcus casseliflavus]|uniref:glycosyltransferase n=1 Tax=Enterococcus casseliflavus TaxID=37734 RepID=UPI0039A68F33